MRYIDKSQKKHEGTQVTQDFLDDVCKNPNGRYSDIRYDNRDIGRKDTFCQANNKGYRNRMINILLNNQRSLCCYCMRKLKSAQEVEEDDKVTIEHIIPSSFTSTNAPRLGEYLNPPFLSSNDIVLTDLFESNGYNQNLPARPHKVAFSNFVTSCNGHFPYLVGKKGGSKSQCCNGARVHEMALPVYFIENIEDLIDFTTKGEIQAKVGTAHENEIDEVIKNAKLNCMSLRDIRRLWFELRFCDYRNIYNCKNESSRDYLFSKILYTSPTITPEDASRLHTKFSDENQWNTFMLYNVFYTIMKTKYPA